MATVTRHARTDTVFSDELGVRLHVFSCVNCAVPWAVPDAFDDLRRDDGKTFYCPNGHPQSYTENTIEAQLRAQVKEAERQARRAVALQEQAEAEAAAERTRTRSVRAELGKARRRTAHGVCPVPDCSRAPFPNLAAHMATKHPGFVAEADHAAGVQVLVDGPYGTMRPIEGPGGRRIWYQCAGGHRVATAGGHAAKHARTCAQARQPWPTNPWVQPVVVSTS